MAEWIINNYPLHPVKESLELFNKTFNSNATYDGYRRKAYRLTHRRRPRYTLFNLEQRKFLINIYKKYSPEKCIKLINEHFDLTITKEQLINYATNHKIVGFYYTETELNWLRDNCKNFTYKDLTEMFNILFNRNKTKEQIRSICKKKHWYCKIPINFFTLEEDIWLKENYPKYELNREEITKLFNEHFGSNRSMESIVNYAKRHKYIKKQSDYQFKNGNRTWSTNLSKEEHRKHFSEKSFDKMFRNYKQNFPNTALREQYEKEHNIKLSKDIRLTDVGNGEYVPVKRKYVERLAYYNLHKEGELSKFIYTVYEAEDLIKNKEKEVKDGNRKESKL